MLQLLLDPQTWISLLTLTTLEIVLGIDNLVFLSIITARLPQHQQKSARQFGLGLACISRLLLLAVINWMTHLTFTLFTFNDQSFSLHNIILLIGGLFLLVKGTNEIHQGIVEQENHNGPKGSARFGWVLVQIMFLDIIFSIDSVFTAVGMAQEFIIMAVAIIIAVLLMLVASEFLSRFVQKYPTLKMLALSFLLLVGAVLIADGFNFHVPREYVYFAIAFSIFVEILNIMSGKRRKRAKQKAHKEKA